jgi:hypothetical protein
MSSTSTEGVSLTRSGLRARAVRAALLLSVAAVGYWWMRSASPGSSVALVPGADPALTPQNADLQRELGQVRRELSSLSAGLRELRNRKDGELAAVTVPLAEGVEGVARPAASEKLDAPRPAPGEPSGIREHLQASFQAQPVEGEWSRREERSLVEYFGSVELGGIELESLECRSTLCRINLRAENLDQLEAFTERLGAPPLNHGVFYQADAEENTLVLFAAREGHALPPLPAGT